MPEIGKLLVFFGIIAVVLGLVLWSGYGNWIGKLPGDIRIQCGDTGFYFPIVTCIVVSVVLSLLFSFCRR